MSADAARWTCPLCQVQIEVPFEIRPEPRRLCDPDPNTSVTLTLTESAMADVFAHAWTHREASE